MRNTNRTTPTRLTLGALFAALSLGACATAATDPAPAPMRQEAAAPAITDAQIAAIVVAANTIDSDMGTLALSRSENGDIRKFAQQMVTDHNAVNEAAVALVTRLGVTPQESATSRGLQASAAEKRAQMETLSGAAFDRAYIANEVAYHQVVLDAIDQALIPGAQNAELKATLVSVRPAIAAHLQHARHLHGSLGGR